MEALQGVGLIGSPPIPLSPAVVVGPDGGVVSSQDVVSLPGRAVKCQLGYCWMVRV